MLAIGSVQTFPELKAESEKVLSVQDVKMRDISLACLVLKACTRFNRSPYFNQSGHYYNKLQELQDKFTDPLLSVYFSKKFMYASHVFNRSLGIHTARKNEALLAITEKPLEPAVIDNLLPYLKFKEEQLSDFRSGAFTSILYSYLPHKNEKGMLKLFKDFPEFSTPIAMKQFCEISKGFPTSKVFKLSVLMRLTFSEYLAEVTSFFGKNVLNDEDILNLQEEIYLFDGDPDIQMELISRFCRKIKLP